MIRVMTMEDYDGVKALWMKIKGFGIRSIDDSREGVELFLKRNPTTSVVAVEDGKIVIDRSACISCGVCVGKCPFGAVAAESETRYQIFLGGTWGKHTRMGTPVSRLVGEDEVLPILEKSILWFKENGQPKERFGKAIDRIGVEKAEAEILGDEILARKAEILAK